MFYRKRRKDRKKITSYFPPKALRSFAFRVAREKELRDPDDVFIHAEERRRELARQGKKRRPLKGS